MPDDTPVMLSKVAEIEMATGVPIRMRHYNILDWYWLADDGRVFSSERQLTIDETDTDYQSFILSGAATPWPRDNSGNQTDAALQAVFDAADIQPPRTIVVSSSKSR